MAKMTVYHGGFVPVPIPEIRIGRNTKDFGNGFYCTVIKEQAQRWARRYRTKETDSGRCPGKKYRCYRCIDKSL